MSATPRGYVIWRGPSQLDGAPIVVVVLTGGSTNSKTGNVIQTYILVENLSPIAAVRAGADRSICGDCPHRGDGTGRERTCYVNLAHGPRAVYDALQRGMYPDATPGQVADVIAGRVLRLGTYGDPAAVPVDVWTTLRARTRTTLGYTHQWRTRPEFRALAMASCDSESERMTAQVLGWRTFTIRMPAAPVPAGDVACPASEEMGKRTTCDRCGLCQGTTRAAKSISIVVHGTGRRHFAAA